MAQADPQSLFEKANAELTGDSDDDRLDGAFGRLDAALSRLERAATLKRPVDAELLQLKLDNAALRETVGDALGQLDTLLADLNADG